MDEKKGFVLFDDQKEVVDKLTDEQAGKIFKAIYEYVETNEVPELDTLLDLVFTPFKTSIDRNQKKWLETKRKRSEAGKKHIGNKYGTKENEMEQNGTNGTNGTNVPNLEQMEQMSQNGTVSVSGSVSDSVSDSVSVSVSGSVSTAVAVDNTQAAATDKVVRFYLDNINPLPTPNEIENLEYYQKQLSEELLIFGMQKAVDQKARKMAYCKKIWDTWISKGISTLEEAKEEAKQHSNKAPPMGFAVTAINKYFDDTNMAQYTDLDRFYAN